MKIRSEGGFKMRVKKWMVIILGISISIIFGFFRTPFAANLDLGEATGVPSTDVTLNITLSTGGASISAVAMDIGYETSLLENPRVDIGPAGSAAGKSVFSSTPSTGVFRIGVLGMNTNPIGDGIVAYVRFKIKSTAPFVDTSLSNNPSASDPNGNSVPISGSPGMIHIQSLPPAQLNLGSGSGSPGGTVKLPITLSSKGWDIAATSNDLQYNPSYLKSPTCEIGPSGTAAGKSVQCNEVSPGLFRVGVLGFNTNTINDGIVAYVTFGIDPSTPLNSVLTIHNEPSASDPMGGSVSVTGEEGEINIIALEISPSEFPVLLEEVNGFAGVIYQWPLQVVGGEAPYLWSIQSGSLPEGVELNPSTGLISGRPLKHGVFPFRVKVVDKNSSEATKDLSLKINLLGDADGNGTVAINELQIVINSYLGIYPPK